MELSNDCLHVPSDETALVDAIIELARAESEPYSRSTILLAKRVASKINDPQPLQFLSSL